MHQKSHSYFLLFIFTFCLPCISREINNFSFELKDDRFRVESIPEILINNIRVQVLYDEPWRSFDHNTSPSTPGDKSPFEDFKEAWKNVGNGIWGGLKEVAHGAGYVGDKLLESIADGVEFIVDIFDPEEPCAQPAVQNNLQVEIPSSHPIHQQTLTPTNTQTNTTPITLTIESNAQPTQSQNNSLGASPTTIYEQTYAHLEETVVDQESSFITYKNELSAHVIELEQSPFESMRDRTIQRLKTFERESDTCTISQKTYTVSQEVTPFMRKHSLDVEAYEVCHGTIIQHQLHQEIIEILTSSYEIDRIFSKYQHKALFTDLVVEGVDLARELNAQGDIVKGFRVADYCGWLNEAEYPRLSYIIKQAGGIVVGAVEGGCNIVKNTYQMLRHPYNTAKGLVIVTEQLGEFLLKATGELGNFAHHISFDGALDDTAYFPPYRKDIDDITENYELQNPYFIHDVQVLEAYYQQMSKEFAELEPEEQTRKITAFCFELYFTGKFIGQLGKVKSAATAHVIKPGVTAIANKLELYRYKAISETYMRVAKTCKTVKEFTRRKLSRSGDLEWVMDGAGNWKEVINIEAGPSIEIPPSTCTGLVPVHEISSVPVSTTKNIADVQRSIAKNLLVERAEAIEFVNHTIAQEASQLLPGAAQQTLNVIRHVPDHIDPAELDRLCLLVKERKNGWGDMKSRFLKIKVKHIFTIELKKNGHINGFHHDFLGYLEEMGIIKLENVRMGKFGEYMTDVVINGITTRNKSFFPKHWNREKVLESIIEAYDNFLEKKVVPFPQLDGKYQIDCFTKEGLKIRMQIDQKCNLLSAYPVI